MDIMNLYPLFLWIVISLAEKFDLDSLEDYTHFLNFGEKKLAKLQKEQLENSLFKSKVDVLGEVFKKNIEEIKVSKKLDLVFLIDASSSVGEYNFQSEIKFVKKVLSDLTVDYNHTRVAVVTFSSPSKITKHVDEISKTSENHNKCNLLNHDLKKIEYKGGETFTLGALETARDIFNSSERYDSKKVIFLITDGYSNGGNPIPLAQELKKKFITIFTIGIRNGNYKELYEVSSNPGHYYSYLLDSFVEFECLARRALHGDLPSGDYVSLGTTKPCDILCGSNDCCDPNATCTCGTTTGHYACLCKPGYYGSGLKNSCHPCKSGFYSDEANICLPCPDLNHVTREPAIGIESCRCKDGYKKSDNYKCQEIKCPEFIVPDNAYLVESEDCSNTWNASCEIRCNIGYTLNGTNIRTCVENGSWSDIHAICEGQYCLNLDVPKEGKLNCFHPGTGESYKYTEQMIVDTECNFECLNGRLLIGSRKRTCLSSKKWDGVNTYCKHIKCNKLPQVKYGKVEPASCQQGKQEVGKACRVICIEGFKVKGSEEIRCIGGYGSWDRNFEEMRCIDVEPPKIDCPANITINTLPGMKFGTISWSGLNITDNSGLNISVWMKPAISDITKFKFKIGKTMVTFYAQDAFQNRAKCTFYVITKDEEPPVIEDCTSPPPFLVPDHDGADISWDEPHIFDNSQKVKVTKTHEFGYFDVGTTVVEYIAVDLSNNRNSCKINITVEISICEAIPDPQNGHSDCVNEDEGIQCLITCEEGYAIPIGQAEKGEGDNFICKNADPFWYSEEDSFYPDCTVTKVPVESTESGDIELEVNPEICNNPEKLGELENEIATSFKTNLCTDDTCSIITDVSECTIEKEEEKSNKIFTKRDIRNYQAVPHKNKNKKLKGKLNIKFQVRGKFLNSTSTINQNTMLSSSYNVTLKRRDKKFLCPKGFVPRKNRCVQCPKGTFHNVTRNKCQSCPIGFYNDKLGQSMCVSCPIHFSTRRMHSKKPGDCKEQCPPGTHARRKRIKYPKEHTKLPLERPTLWPYCRSCGVGYYQSEYGQVKCARCPTGTTTLTAASANRSQCVEDITAEEICKKNICGIGTCIVNDIYQYSCDCPKDYIGTYCEKQIDFCESQPCYNGGSCFSAASGFSCVCKSRYTGKYCEKAIMTYPKKCFNNGTLYEDDKKEIQCLCQQGYKGDSCETKVNYCYKDLCLNNSTCYEMEGTFKCECTKGFTGKRCSLLPCDYNPCSRFEICINSIDSKTGHGHFMCECPKGYKGEECNQKINICDSSPCLNGGSCIDRTSTYFCSCTALYYGINCQHKRDTKYVLNFQSNDMYSYIALDGFNKNLSEVTACFWMQTLDNFNYGTIISYATRDKYNAFSITDYSGLVIYLNNHPVITDISLNDGLWHHVCISWNSSRGAFVIYLNGEQVKNGTGLSPGTLIEGRGIMIIGQDQDSFGGSFSQSESFVGKMAYIDMWARSLSFEEVLKHYKDCNDSFYGDLYAWAPMKDHVRSGVEVIKSSFCQKCEAPRPLYNGYINIVDNVAHYSCYKGYQLNNARYAIGRKCTKASKWEGLYESYCKRVNCGYPGHIRHGYPLGNRFFYEDKLTYICYEGFQLEGNSTIICTENGEWTEKPKCVGLQCPGFSKPEHSNLEIHSDQSYEDYQENITQFDIGTQLDFTCNEKANLSGENIITCLENGTWDYELPKCVVKKPELGCPMDKIPTAPNHGYIVEDTLFAAANASANFVEYKCDKGYKLQGVNITTCIIDGYWTVPNITCDAITCGKPQIPKNALVDDELQTKNTYEFGKSIRFKCEEGYNVAGSTTIRCLINGRWSRMQGKCIKKPCRKPNVKPSTLIQGKSYLYGDKVKITCSSGSTYELVCNKRGIWEGNKDKSC